MTYEKLFTELEKDFNLFLRDLYLSFEENEVSLRGRFVFNLMVRKELEHYFTYYTRIDGIKNLALYKSMDTIFLSTYTHARYVDSVPIYSELNNLDIFSRNCYAIDLKDKNDLIDCKYSDVYLLVINKLIKEMINFSRSNFSNENYYLIQHTLTNYKINETPIYERISNNT